MHVAEAKQDLAHVELGQPLGEASLLEQVKEELAARADVHHEVELALALERPVQLDDEGVVELLEHASLAQDRLDLVLADQPVLPQDLDRVQPTRVLLPGEYNATEAASSNDPHLLEIIYTDIAPLRQAQRKALVLGAIYFQF